MKRRLGETQGESQDTHWKAVAIMQAGDYRSSGQGGPGGGGEILVIVFRLSPQDLLVD